MSEHDAPGWQADPTGRHDHRYWDGTRWTDDVADAGVASTDPFDADLDADLDAGDAPTAIDEPTVVDEPAPPLADDVTAVPGTPADSTATWASTPAPPPPPTYVPPAAALEEPPRSKRGLLIGGGILALAIVALVAFLVLGGDDDDDRSRIHSALTSELRDEGDLTDVQADCVADHIIDEVGVDKLKDVDFSDDDPPAALADELGDAAFSSISECDIDLNQGEGDDADDDSPLTPDDIEALGPDFEDQLAEVYAGMGIARDKAECLADKIADAVEDGSLEAEDAMADFFAFFSACDINPSEITGG